MSRIWRNIKSRSNALTKEGILYRIQNRIGNLSQLKMGLYFRARCFRRIASWLWIFKNL